MNMKESAKEIGGELEINSEKGSGTKIKLIIPNVSF
jgi:signal transduction histidine kinase